MSEIYDKIRVILADYDQQPNKAIDQTMVVEELKKIIPTNDYKASFEEEAEYIAFSLVDQFKNSRISIGSYFGPQIAWVGDDGQQYEWPSKSQITPAMIEYWEQRMKEAKHPFLLSRYTGLVWDLSQVISGQIPSHDIRKQYVAVLLGLIDHRLFTHPLSGIFLLRRALEIAARFNDQEFYAQIKDLTLSLETEFAESDKPGLWGFGYDILVRNKKLNPSNKEIEGVIDRLETKLARVCTPNEKGKTDPWAAEAAAERLAEYYTRENKPDEVKRVILSVGNAYEPIFENASAIQVSGWLEKIIDLYKHYQLNEEAEIVLKRLRQISATAADEMGGFEHKFEIPKEKIDELLSQIFDGDIESILSKIINHFTPNKEDAKNMLFQLAKEVPMQFSIPIHLQDAKGRTIAMVNSLENDLEGHIVLRISEHLQFSALPLHLVMDHGIQSGLFTTNVIIAFLSQSAIINKSRHPILSKALDNYFVGEYMIFIHLVIPQIEEAIRNMIELNGGNVLKYKNNIFNLRIFDDILRDPIVALVVGEDVQSYLKILFTDNRGWNLRNDVCHGMIEPELFTKQSADRVLHALLSLGLVRYKEEQKV